MAECIYEAAAKKEYILPVAVKAGEKISEWENLLIGKPACVSFRNDSCCVLRKKAHMWCWILARSCAAAYA